MEQIILSCITKLDKYKGKTITISETSKTHDGDFSARFDVDGKPDYAVVSLTDYVIELTEQFYELNKIV